MAKLKKGGGGMISRNAYSMPGRIEKLIPVAGGEQEYSQGMFRWMIQNPGVGIRRPEDIRKGAECVT